MKGKISNWLEIRNSNMTLIVYGFELDYLRNESDSWTLIF